MTADRPKWAQLRDSDLRADDLLMGVIRPPVSVFSIIKQLGIDLHFVDNPGWDSASRRVGDKAYIWISNSIPLRKRRFMAAHSLGHILLSPDEEYREGFSVRGTHPVEVEATKFALELLLPEWMVHPSVRNHSSIPSIWNQILSFFGKKFPPAGNLTSDLSDVFFVPEWNVTARLLQLYRHRLRP